MESTLDIYSGNIMTGDFPSLQQLLEKNDKKGLFRSTTTNLGFPTGFMPLDYRNGYRVYVYDDNDKVVGQYNNVGIFGGSFNTVIGKSGSAKTTLTVQMAANIARYCMDRFRIPCDIHHIDAERASNITRIKNVIQLPIQAMKAIYKLNDRITYIEDIYDYITDICAMKAANRELFYVNSGFRDEFQNEIWMYVPSIIIIDSLPSIATRDGAKLKKSGKKDEDVEVLEDLQTGTYANRVAKAISRFYKQTLPLVKEFNLIVFAINHINKKIEIGGMPTQPQTMYLKMDESLPCGFAPIYYAHNIFKIVTRGKLTMEKDFVDGFVGSIELLKSRSNKAGKSCELIYDQASGFDIVLSLVHYLKSIDMIGGRNPYCYIKGFEDQKFDMRKVREHCAENPALLQTIRTVASVSMEDILSGNRAVDTAPSVEGMADVVGALKDSYDNDESFAG